RQDSRDRLPVAHVVPMRDDASAALELALQRRDHARLPTLKATLPGTARVDVGLPGGSWGRLVLLVLPLVLRQAALSRPTGSERQRDDEIGEARQLIEPLNEFLHASDGAGAEHHTR